jgi:hypothetical protein
LKNKIILTLVKTIESLYSRLLQSRREIELNFEYNKNKWGESGSRGKALRGDSWDEWFLLK